MRLPAFRAAIPAPLFPVAACVLGLLAAAPCPAGAGGEDGLAETRAMVESGRFEEALARLPPPGDTADAEALFLQGLAAIGASRRPGLAAAERDALLDRAIAALRRVLISRPGLVRVRLELARAFFLKREDDLARRHFERVLAGKPPPNVAANVGRFLAEIGARRRWSFNLGASLAPDSNIGSAPGQRVVYLSGQPSDEVAGIEPVTSGVGVVLWGGAEYELPLGRGRRLRAGADVSRWEYEGLRFDRILLSGHVGPRWPVDARSEASLLASARQVWIGGAPNHRDLGARVELEHRASPGARLFMRASWHARRHRLRSAFDGPVTSALLAFAWAPAPTLRAELSVRYGRERPRTERWRRRSLSLGAGISASLPLGFTLGGGAVVRRTDFSGSWGLTTRDGSSRRDRTRSLTASIHNRGVTLGGFSPELVLTWEERTTNAQLYDYERVRGDLRLVRQF